MLNKRIAWFGNFSESLFCNFREKLLFDGRKIEFLFELSQP
jgi:hypothetical protein